MFPSSTASLHYNKNWQGYGAGVLRRNQRLWCCVAQALKFAPALLKNIINAVKILTSHQMSTAAAAVVCAFSLLQTACAVPLTGCMVPRNGLATTTLP